MCDMFQLWKIILLLGVREQLHHVTFLELAVGEAVCVMQALSRAATGERLWCTSAALCPSPRAMQPSHTQGHLSSSMYSTDENSDPFPAPGRIHFSGSQYSICFHAGLLLPRSMLTPSVALAGQSSLAPGSVCVFCWTVQKWAAWISAREDTVSTVTKSHSGSFWPQRLFDQALLCC